MKILRKTFLFSESEENKKDSKEKALKGLTIGAGAATLGAEGVKYGIKKLGNKKIVDIRKKEHNKIIDVLDTGLKDKHNYKYNTNSNTVAYNRLKDSLRNKAGFDTFRSNIEITGSGVAADVMRSDKFKSVLKEAGEKLKKADKRWNRAVNLSRAAQVAAGVTTLGAGLGYAAYKHHKNKKKDGKKEEKNYSVIQPQDIKLYSKSKNSEKVKAFTFTPTEEQLGVKYIEKDIIDGMRYLKDHPEDKGNDEIKRSIVMNAAYLKRLRSNYGYGSLDLDEIEKEAKKYKFK